MVRLILEQDGKRRIFRVGDGVLTVGGDSSMNLQLEGSSVAAQAAELEIVGDHAKLRVCAGAEAPLIDGETVLGEVELHIGQALELGGASFWLEDESSRPGSRRPSGLRQSPGASPGGPRKTGKASPQGGTRRSSSRRAAADPRREAARDRAIQRAQGKQNRGRVQRTRARSKAGLPTGAVLGIVAVVLLVGGFALRKAFKVSAENSINVAAVLAGAERYIDQALYTKAEDQLKLINMEKATLQERDRLRELRAEIAAGYKKQERKDSNRVGNKYFDNLLKDYEKNYLQGNPSTPKIRLFLKRCKTFRSRWPDHEGMEWVSRQERRFNGAVNLSLPPTFADIDWEVKFILGGTPRRYEVALDMIDEYLERTDTSPLDKEAMQALRASIEKERPAQFEDAMQWAKYEYENGDDEKAVQWLVFAAAYMEDSSMEDRAAEYLMQMPHLKGHLEAYQLERPDVFEALMENDIAHAKAEEFGLL